MKEQDKENSFMYKVAATIVDKRKIVILLYIAGIIFSFISSNWVKVNNDITEYLPDDTVTRQGLSVMEDEFVTLATARVMVTNITYEKAEQLEKKIEDLPVVEMMTFDDTEEHYKDACALYDVTLIYESGDEAAYEGYDEIRECLKDYDVYISQSDVDRSTQLANEMSLILAVAAVIIVVVLVLTSKAYMEVPVLLLTFVAGLLLNKGTNFMCGEISFVSNSVTAVLQLALSIDYAIILIHHYSEERESNDIRESVVIALSKSIPEIASSSLTTVSGLMALMFMQFQLGFDLGICLIKSIIFSLLSVFTLMPCLLMYMGKFIDKTHHKNLLPDMSWLGSLAYKLRIIIPPIFVGVILLGYYLSSNCPYVYDSNSSKTSKKSEMQIADEMIEERFGKKNTAAIVVPKGDYDREKMMIAELKQYEEVGSVTALSDLEVSDDYGYVLTDKITPRQFSELTDMDIETSKLLYTLYAADNEDYSQLITNMNSFAVPIIDLFTFAYDLKTDGYIHFDDEEMNNDLDELNDKLSTAKKQLLGENYTRILLNLDLPMEGDETFSFIDKVNEITAKYYDDFYFVGNSTSCDDLANAFATDNLVVSLLSVFFVILVLFFTFQNGGLPVLLIMVIQGSVWINFSVPYITKTPLYFLSYLIISSIQMGANIDYAIVISSRYMEIKKNMEIKQAMRESMAFAFPTIFTSGSILASAGFLISKLSTDPTIVSIGQCLCRGTLISIILVLFVLPEILLLGDTILEKSGVTIKTPEIVRKETGQFTIDGHVRGMINGYVDADIKGRIRGDMEAIVNIDTITKEKPNADENKLIPEETEDAIENE